MSDTAGMHNPFSGLDASLTVWLRSPALDRGERRLVRVDIDPAADFAAVTRAVCYAGFRPARTAMRPDVKHIIGTVNRSELAQITGIQGVTGVSEGPSLSGPRPGGGPVLG